jgi:hypothetical protein
MSEQHEERKKRGFPWLAAFAVAMPAFYAMSIGPAWCLVMAGSIGEETWWIIYSPLITLSEVAGHKSWVQDYIGWWGRLFGYL